MQKITSLCEAIKKVRLDKNLSQERFGKKIGVSGKSVSAYETGKSVPPLRILDAISKNFDTSMLQISKEKQGYFEEKSKNIKNSLTELEDIIINSFSL